MLNAAPEPGLTAARQQAVVAALLAVLPARCVLSDAEDTRPYECDGLAAYRQLPMVVTLPDTEEQVIAILGVCRELKVPTCRAAPARACRVAPCRSPTAWCCRRRA